jgi:superfamily II DNA or RNA helicase
MPRRSTRQNARPPFSSTLILNKYMFKCLGFDSFEPLAGLLKHAKEGLDENQTSYFYKAIVDSADFSKAWIDKDLLLSYDQNIVKHTNEMQGRRQNPVTWKYFQYLCLLFVEIYLDKFFKDPLEFAYELNKFKNGFNEFVDIPDYTSQDLRKIAIWNATGSGKTLLMHANILQYQHYLNFYHQNKELNKILLITPNEGLSRQHLAEFTQSGISAEFFNKNSGRLFSSHVVEIIEITKLKDEGKETTISVDSFENNNLVLIDEVHKGTQGKEWRSKRNQLSTAGFAFEYSATLGQAVKAANDETLSNEYAKATLFDYSYKWFYNDGYGKDYRILNLADDSVENTRKLYLTGCLLAFYQQYLVFQNNKQTIKPFNIEKPLWIFVGGTVKAVRSVSGRKVSDVMDILLFISDFINNKDQSIERLNRLMKGNTGLLDTNQNDVFSNAFTLVEQQGGLFGEELYNDILRRVFNAPAQGKIHLKDLKGADGEIALTIADNEPFGLINVGDSSELLKLCSDYEELVISDLNFNGSMFDKIKSEGSTINVLIGSKKFTEGWDCFRVSTMGLMNIGRSEGSEIIQLFGRGVRLKGYNKCLKRSSALSDLNLSTEKSVAVRCLETLHIFGVRADYMRQFQEYLEDEGLPSGSNVKEEFVIPVIKTLPKTNLKVIKLKEGLDFKKQADRPLLSYTETLSRNPIVLDWYPRIQAMKSARALGGTTIQQKQSHVLTQDLLAFIDWQSVYLEMQAYKAEKAWYNLDLSISDIKQIFHHNDWYVLYIPQEDLQLVSFDVFDRIQHIVVSLLKKYCDRFYAYKKADWEKDKLEYRDLTSDDPNFIDEYKILVQEQQQDVINRIKELEALVKTKQFNDLNFITGCALYFDKHLYNPILALSDNDIVEIKPVALNDGEKKFIEDLRGYYTKNKENFNGQELYLLRNRSKGIGYGFFEEGNFYPDFILWHIEDGIQYITFIDPKGIRNLDGQTDPKITFYTRIKEIEHLLGNKNIILNSAIISNTPIQNVNWRGDWVESDFINHNIFFQTEDGKYIGNIFNIYKKS